MAATVTPPMWAIKRALTLFGQWGNLGVDTHPATYAFARYIAQHEQPPVDPDVLALREIVAVSHEAEGYHERGAEVRAGKADDRPSFQAALAAYRKHKEAGE